LSDQYYRIKMHIMTLILLKVKNKERAWRELPRRIMVLVTMLGHLLPRIWRSTWSLKWMRMLVRPKTKDCPKPHGRRPETDLFPMPADSSVFRNMPTSTFKTKTHTIKKFKVTNLKWTSSWGITKCITNQNSLWDQSSNWLPGAKLEIKLQIRTLEIYKYHLQISNNSQEQA